jgi:putative tryptophan/tyrosine transport system ATP-binding protein
MNNQFAIEVKDLNVVYNDNSANEVIAIKNFSLKVEKGEIIVITGNNGAGKSTLLNAIAGIVPIKTGQIFIEGKCINKWNIKKRAEIIGFVHQDTMLGTCPNLTINENVQLTKSNNLWNLLPYSLSLTQEQENNLKELGFSLESRQNTKINMLSGGQKQLISVCLAFEKKKQILLFDEFTSALDEYMAKKILDFTFKKANKEKTTILMVMHNIDIIKNYNYRLIKL